MKTIITKTIPETNAKPRRIKASDCDGNKLTISNPDFAQSIYEAHEVAAREFIRQEGWTVGKIQGGEIDGGRYAWIETKPAPKAETNVEYVDTDERRALWRNLEEFHKLFGVERFNRHLAKVRFASIVEEHHGSEPKWVKGAIHIGRKWQCWKEYKGEFYKDCSGQRDTWLVPSQYQGLQHTDVVKACLLEMFPWLASFNFRVYELRFYKNGGVEEFYIDIGDATGTGHDSLYVPFAAFLARDRSAIEARNFNYLQSYNAKDGRSIAEKIVSSGIAQRFLALVEQV